jgi:hypothetical protein
MAHDVLKASVNLSPTSTVHDRTEDYSELYKLPYADDNKVH